MDDQLASKLPEVRERLGRIWGLDRAISKAELARALDLSPDHGGGFIGKIEKGGPKAPALSGPIRQCILMMLDGARPHTMDGVIKPGYPRGL